MRFDVDRVRERNSGNGFREYCLVRVFLHVLHERLEEEFKIVAEHGRCEFGSVVPIWWVENM